MQKLVALLLSSPPAVTATALCEYDIYCKVCTNLCLTVENLVISILQWSIQFYNMLLPLYYSIFWTISLCKHILLPLVLSS